MRREQSAARAGGKLVCADVGIAGTPSPPRAEREPAADRHIAALWVGVVLLAALALVPRRRVHVAANVLVAVLSEFIAVQLAQISVAHRHPVVLDSPLTGEVVRLQRRAQRSAQPPSSPGIGGA